MAKKTSQPRRKLVDIRKDNSEQILAEAARVFAKHGFRGTTVNAIAEQANLPKANVLYYFKTKEGLYKAVLNQQLNIWMANMDAMTSDSHPKDALRQYIVDKIKQSKEHPNASKIFAAEILHGAEFLKETLETELKDQFDRTCAVFRSWIQKQWMDPISPEHLLFTIWSSTQAYADYQAQTTILLGKPVLDDDDFEAGIELLTCMVLKGCGVRLV
ncbi:TetR family transcriptional regulator C-terminal domain-containing protein [Reinekea blandensis]|uniref:Transcriptional regulator n=1 Tax=Reinekea blandensis MED297 TaxID=314283 RepID=A4BFN4_9GAMM|nr:TetR family transcriptional regulator C-terminal domain-containing protein [Reinekea blandensis]EAR09129.1 Transcriptional regulator [Reinekea sp. MED297] [Reinekea blandensis MED297]